MIFHIFLLALLGYTQTMYCATEGGAASGGGRRRSTTTESSDSDSSPRTSGTSEHSGASEDHSDSSTKKRLYMQTGGGLFYDPIRDRVKLAVPGLGAILSSRTVTQAFLRVLDPRPHVDDLGQHLAVKFNPNHFSVDLTQALHAATSEEAHKIFQAAPDVIPQASACHAFEGTPEPTLALLQSVLTTRKSAALTQLKEAEIALRAISIIAQAAKIDLKSEETKDKE
jgi:hypothetical protein